MSEPLVFTVMPTMPKRRHYLPRAIRNWQAQTWPSKRLLVLDGHPDSDGANVADLIPRDDTRVVYGYSSADTLGAKYNDGCAMAPEGTFIAFQGDDDWSHPMRVELTVHAMLATMCDIGGSVSILAYRERDRSVLHYRHPFTLEPAPPDKDGRPMTQVTEPYLVGATMIVHRSRWAECRFPAQQSSSDTLWAKQLLSGNSSPGDEFHVTAESSAHYSVLTSSYKGRELRYLQLDDPGLYVAFLHGGGHTGNGMESGEDSGPCWRKAACDITALMGVDAREYGL